MTSPMNEEQVQARIEGLEREVDPGGAQLVAELMRDGGAVGARGDLRRLDHVARELREDKVDDLDVVWGSVGARVAGARHAGQCLARLIQISQQRVKAEPPLKVPAAPSFSECAVIKVASYASHMAGPSRWSSPLRGYVTSCP